jgi:dTDP-4-amino-4,6-dideoxygalactose transaminase
MKIPQLDLKAQYQSIKDEIDKKLSEVLSSQRFILGPEVNSFESEMSAFLGVSHAVGVSSGSDALIISLMALGIGQGDAVVTTPFTFFATAGAVARLGATPVFCDIDQRTFNISPDKLEELLAAFSSKNEGSNIKAVIPVHLYGQCADMDPIAEIAKKYEMAIIEDAAQAVGSEYPSLTGIKKACGLGDLGILSFFPSKNLSAFGDAGMVLTNSDELAEKLNVLRVHGSSNKYFYDVLGGNFRLDAVQAAVLRVKLQHLSDWIKKRMEKASNYDKLFEERGLVKKEIVQIPLNVYKESGAKYYHTYHQYVIRAGSRDKLKEHLSQKEIATAIYYPFPLHLQKCFTYLGYKEGDFPESEKAVKEVLALPIYPELSSDQQEYIVDSIAEFYE